MILLVEDNEDDIFFLQRAVKKASIETPLQVVRDGRQAIDYLLGTGPFADRAEFPLPSLVLLDLKLPLVHGLDVLKWIRAQPRLATLIVVVLTSSHLDADVRQAYQLGANSFLVKAASAEKLTEMVKCMHEYWLQHNRLAPSEDPVV